MVDAQKISNLNLLQANWESVSEAVDKLLDIEAAKDTKTLTDDQFALLERIFVVEDVKAQVMQWLDTGVIAENILEELKDAELEPTFENAKYLWLDFLETELHEGLKASVENCPQFNP